MVKISLGRVFYLWKERKSKVMIRIKNVSKSFTQRNKQPINAVVNVSLDINPGEVFGIIGYSGAGKSTLIRLINMLEKPTEGTIFFDGVDLSKVTEKELREARIKMGMIFQNFNLMHSRTVYENISLALKKSSLSRGEKMEKINKLLDLVGIADKKDAFPSQLSGGQQQRVAIARALANDPKVLLCDEATSALDPKATKAILDLLKSLNEKLGITIVLITHEMSVIKDICDRVAIMENGEVLEVGETMNTFVQPKNKSAKEFIQTANNLDKILETLEKNRKLSNINHDDKVLIFTFWGDDAPRPLISTIVKQCDITINIIYGSVETFKDKPLGRMVVTMSGSSENMEKAFAYIKTSGIDLEVIR